MARRYFVHRSPIRRRSSAAPLIFEKVVWGVFLVVALSLVLSFFWRHKAAEQPQDTASIRNKIIREIPRAQLELANSNRLSTSEEENALLMSIGGDQTPDQLQPTDTKASGSEQDQRTATANAESRSIASDKATPATEGSVTEATSKQPTSQSVNALPGVDSRTSNAQAPAGVDQPTAGPAPSAAQPLFIVRVGAFKSRANVQEICDRIHKLGYDTQVWEYSHSQLGQLLMVELTPFKDKDKALRAKAEVEKQERLQAKLITKE
jgi:cell division septation protein DedD